jgi:hypothetical protein
MNGDKLVEPKRPRLNFPDNQTNQALCTFLPAVAVAPQKLLLSRPAEAQHTVR